MKVRSKNTRVEGVVLSVDYVWPNKKVLLKVLWETEDRAWKGFYSCSDLIFVVPAGRREIVRCP